jgi:hypothetical protein
MKRKSINLTELDSVSYDRNSQMSRMTEPGHSIQLPEGRSELIALERKRSKMRLQKLNLDIDLDISKDTQELNKTKQKAAKEKSKIAQWAIDDAMKESLPNKKSKKEVDDVDNAVAEEVGGDLDSLLSNTDDKEKPDSDEETEADDESNESSSEFEDA